MNKQKHIKRLYHTKRSNFFIKDIKENPSIYLTILIIFIVGLFIGTITINRLSDTNKEYINESIISSINLLKNGENLIKREILFQSIMRNLFIILLVWAIGSTFLGKYLLYFLVLFFGITFGYTTSAIMISFDIWKGLLFFISTIFLHNLITIPTIIFLTIQGIKCYNIFRKNNNIR